MKVTRPATLASNASRASHTSSIDELNECRVRSGFTSYEFPLRVKVCKKIYAWHDTIGSPSTSKWQSKIASICRRSLTVWVPRCELRTPRSLPRRCLGTNRRRARSNSAHDWSARGSAHPVPAATSSKTRTLRRTAAKVVREQAGESAR